MNSDSPPAQQAIDQTSTDTTQTAPDVVELADCCSAVVAAAAKDEGVSGRRVERNRSVLTRTAQHRKSAQASTRNVKPDHVGRRFHSCCAVAHHSVHSTKRAARNPRPLLIGRRQLPQIVGEIERARAVSARRCKALLFAQERAANRASPPNSQMFLDESTSVAAADRAPGLFVAA